MRRFFIAPQSISAKQIILSPEESHHVTSVLRLEKGNAIELFDGTGTVYRGVILTVSPDRTTVEIVSRSTETQEEFTQLFLFQSMLKGKKMDFLVQKATELGVHAFCPVITRYSENRSNISRQADRWQRIMLEACKQSKRAHPMVVEPALPLDKIDLSRFAKPLLLFEGEKSTRLQADMIDPYSPTAVLIGPEGGFSAEEVELLERKGSIPVSLGHRILRAETAALSAVVIIQFLGGALTP